MAPSPESIDPRIAALRLERIRADRLPGAPARSRSARRPAPPDPTLAPMLSGRLAELRLQQRAIAQAGPAVFSALPRELSTLVAPLTFIRGTLTLGVPDDATRFRVDRSLRAGGRTAIMAMMKAPVRAIKVIVSNPRPDTPSLEMPRPPSQEDLDREAWDQASPPG